MLTLPLLRVATLLASLTLALSTDQTRPSQSTHGTLKFTYSPNITRVTFDNPPINLFDINFGADLLEFLQSLRPNPNSTSPTSTTNSSFLPPPKVVIFSSADPEIFASHLDLNSILHPTLPSSTTLITQLYDIVSLLRTTTTVVFISELNGLATGFGNEFIVQTDIRFAGPGARASQLENAGGLLAGAGGQQAVPRLIGRGRGLEYLLASKAVDGPTGARIGWFNEYFDTTAKLRNATDALAQRIASSSSVASIQATKAGLLELLPGPDVYRRDMEALVRLAGTVEVQGNVKRILEAGRNQSRSEFELGLPDTLVGLFQ